VDVGDDVAEALVVDAAHAGQGPVHGGGDVADIGREAGAAVGGEEGEVFVVILEPERAPSGKGLVLVQDGVGLAEFGEEEGIAGGSVGAQAFEACAGGAGHVGSLKGAGHGQGAVYRHAAAMGDRGGAWGGFASGVMARFGVRRMKGGKAMAFPPNRKELTVLTRMIMLAAAAAVAMPATTARAQTLFTTFGPNDSHHAVHTTGFGTQFSQICGVRFVPATTRLIGQVDAALSGGSGSVPVRLEIREDAAGIPSDTVLSTGSHPGVSGRAVYTFNMSTALLIGGQTYWLVADTAAANTFGIWYDSSPGVVGTTAARGGGVGPNWVTFPGTEVPAFRVSGTAEMGACCSPVNGGCRVLSITDCTSLGLSYIAGLPCSPDMCAGECRADFNDSGDVTVQDLFDYLAAFFSGCP